MRFRPMNGYCVVRRADSEAVSPGGIVIPETAQKKSEMGQVLAVCPGWVEDGEYKTSDLRVGDIVVFSKYVGEEFKLDGTSRVLLIKESSLLSQLVDDDDDEEDESTESEPSARMASSDRSM